MPLAGFPDFSAESSSRLGIFNTKPTKSSVLKAKEGIYHLPSIQTKQPTTIQAGEGQGIPLFSQTRKQNQGLAPVLLVLLQGREDSDSLPADDHPILVL